VSAARRAVALCGVLVLSELRVCSEFGCAEDSALYSGMIELMRECRIPFAPVLIAGVAELADALDSKSAVMLRSNAAIAVLLPNQRILVAPFRIALKITFGLPDGE